MLTTVTKEKQYSGCPKLLFTNTAGLITKVHSECTISDRTRASTLGKLFTKLP